MATAKDKDADKVFDVSKPGGVSPDATSKPVIVGHKPLVGDPMVRENVPVSELSATDQHDIEAEEAALHEAEAAATEDDKGTKITVNKPSSSRRRPAIPQLKPSDELVERVSRDKAAGDSAAPELGSSLPEYVKKDNNKTVVAEAPAEPAVKQPEQHTSSYDASPDSDIDASNSVLGSAKSEKEAEVEEVTRQETTDALVESGVYKVQLGKAPHHKGKNSPAVFLLIMIVLVAILGYLAIDSGFIKSSLRLPYHFFKQQSAEEAVVSPPVVTTKVSPPVTTPAIAANESSYMMVGAKLKFSYPTAWGSVLVTPEKGYTKRSATASSDGTYAYITTFNTNKDVELVVTSNKYLPTSRDRLYYDYLLWCSLPGGKYFQEMMTTVTTSGVDTPGKIICDQGPLSGVTPVDSSTIQLSKATGGVPPSVIGDVYIKNLDTTSDLVVMHVKDATTKNATEIKKLLRSVTAAP